MAMVAVTAVLGTACYTHVPVDFTVPRQGEIVRAELTPAGTQEAVSKFGPGVGEVRGMTLENDSVTLSILVSGVHRRQGLITVDAAPFQLQRSHVATVYERKLSVGRSVLFGAGLIAGALLAVEGLDALGRQFDSEDIGDPPPGPSIRIPLSGSGLTLWPGR